MPRMRTPAAAIGLLKEMDDGTCYTLWALRQDIKQGRIPYIRTGRKYLVNFDVLLTFLETSQEQKTPTELAKIRRIDI